MTALRVFIPFSLGFFLSYAVRNVNAVLAPDLAQAMSLTPAMLGLMSSAYLLAFALFQLPLGLLLDRFGPRRVESVLLVIAAAGCVLFATGTTLTQLVVARALIGLGVSACLMGAFKAFIQWFPAERLALVNGAIMAIGGLGALVATAPVEAMLAYTDWRGVLLALGAVAALAAMVIFLAVPRRPDEHGPASEGLAEQMDGLGKVLRSAYFWRLAPISLTVQSAMLSIQGLWAGPWLRDIAGLDRDGVASHLLAITIAMVAGFLTLGLLSERLERANVRPTTFATWSTVGAIASLASLTFEVPLPPLVAWCAFGFFGGAGILYYPLLTRRFPTHLAGRVVTSANVVAFAGAFVAQWGIGAVIERWPVAADGGYHPAGYRTGFVIVLACEILALVWLLAPRRYESARH